jgi:hypothetical protein
MQTYPDPTTNTFKIDVESLRFLLDAKGEVYYESDALLALVNSIRAQGWVSAENLALTDDRKVVVALSRIINRKDPLARNAMRIWNAFVIGRGPTWSILKEDENHAYAKLLKSFWSHPYNAKIFSLAGQLDMHRTLLREGELTFIIHLNQRIPTVSFLADSLEVTNVLVHPGDENTPIYLERSHRPFKWQISGAGSRKVYQDKIRTYYRHAGVDDRLLFSSLIQPPDNSIPRAVVLHLTLEKFGGRGWPLSEASQAWIRTFASFMSDRATLSKSLSRFAWQVKGGAGTFSKVDTLLGKDAEDETPAGSTWVSTKPLVPIKPQTGANDAKADGRLFRQAVGAGVSITEPNLTGDPSTGNLASLTAMDGTMAKNFMMGQGVLADFWRDVFTAAIVGSSLDLALHVSAREFVDKAVLIDYPPVLMQEFRDLVTGLVTSSEHLPDEWLSNKLLSIFGENRPELILKSHSNSNSSAEE